MTKKKKVSNKKKKSSPKKTKPRTKKREEVCAREKVYGDPMPVKPLRPVSDYYNLETGEIYPKVFFKESFWTRLKRFLGLVP